MRYSEINELAGVKRFKDMNSNQILKYISDKLGSGNIKLLGKGSHGCAIQIGANVYKLWMIDSSYTAFVNYCLANQNNPYLPKFYSNIKKMPAFFIRHADAPDYVYYIKMEKLIVSDLSKTNITLSTTSSKTCGFHWVVRTIESMRDTPDINLEFFKRLNLHYGIDLSGHSMTDELTLLVKTIFDLSKLGHELDLENYDNIMVRASDGGIVLLDPLYNSTDFNLNCQFTKFNNGKLPAMSQKPAITSAIGKTK